MLDKIRSHLQFIDLGGAKATTIFENLMNKSKPLYEDLYVYILKNNLDILCDYGLLLYSVMEM